MAWVRPRGQRTRSDETLLLRILNHVAADAVLDCKGRGHERWLAVGRVAAAVLRARHPSSSRHGLTRRRAPRCASAWLPTTPLPRLAAWQPRALSWPPTGGARLAALQLGSDARHAALAGRNAVQVDNGGVADHLRGQAGMDAGASTGRPSSPAWCLHRLEAAGAGVVP